MTTTSPRPSPRERIEAEYAKEFPGVPFERLQFDVLEASRTAAERVIAAGDAREDALREEVAMVIQDSKDGRDAAKEEIEQLREEVERLKKNELAAINALYFDALGQPDLATAIFHVKEQLRLSGTRVRELEGEVTHHHRVMNDQCSDLQRLRAELARLSGVTGCCVECESKEKKIDQIRAEFNGLRLARRDEAQERHRRELISLMAAYRAYNADEPPDSALTLVLADLAVIDEYCAKGKP